MLHYFSTETGFIFDLFDNLYMIQTVCIIIKGTAMNITTISFRCNPRSVCVYDLIHTNTTACQFPDADFCCYILKLHVNLCWRPILFNFAQKLTYLIQIGLGNIHSSWLPSFLFRIIIWSSHEYIGSTKGCVIFKRCSVSFRVNL